MVWVKTGFLILIMARVIYTDTKYGKIENWVIGAGYGMAFLLAYKHGGLIETGESVKAAFIMICMLFFLFVIKGLGAGDIKLFSVIAAFFPEMGFKTVIFSFLIGTLFIGIRAIYRVVTKQIIYIKGETIHFSLPIAVALGFEIVGSHINLI